MLTILIFSRRRSLSYRNQSIDLFCKWKEWFLYDRGLSWNAYPGSFTFQDPNGQITFHDRCTIVFIELILARLNIMHWRVMEPFCKNISRLLTVNYFLQNSLVADVCPCSKYGFAEAATKDGAEKFCNVHRKIPKLESVF